MYFCIYLKVCAVNRRVSKCTLFTKTYIHDSKRGKHTCYARSCSQPVTAADAFSPEQRCFWGALGFKGGRADPGVCLGCPGAPPLRPRGHADADALRGERRPPGWLRACPRRRLPPARTPSAPVSVSGTQPADPGTGAVLLATAAPRQLRRPHMQARTRPVGDRPLSGGAVARPLEPTAQRFTHPEGWQNVADGEGGPRASHLLCVLWVLREFTCSREEPGRRSLHPAAAELPLQPWTATRDVGRARARRPHPGRSALGKRPKQE